MKSSVPLKFKMEDRKTESIFRKVSKTFPLFVSGILLQKTRDGSRKLLNNCGNFLHKSTIKVVFQQEQDKFYAKYDETKCILSILEGTYNIYWFYASKLLIFC